MPGFDYAIAIALGVSLAAATGFRVFLPMLIVSVAANEGYLPLSEGFAWLGTPVALTMLAAAALLEILAYYIPGVDNLLDALATPTSFVAGTVLAAAVMTDLPPMVKWTAAIVAGGGAAGLTQTASALLRAHSTALTAGFGNSVVATAELIGALLLSLIAVAAPLLALVLVAILGWFALRLARRLSRGSRPPPAKV